MNIYMVYGTLKGKVKRSVAWQVASRKSIEDFTEYFKEFVPEYDIEVLRDTLFEMQIVHSYKLSD